MARAAQQMPSSKTDHYIEHNLALPDVKTSVNRNVLYAKPYFFSGCHGQIALVGLGRLC